MLGVTLLLRTSALVTECASQTDLWLICPLLSVLRSEALCSSHALYFSGTCCDQCQHGLTSVKHDLTAITIYLPSVSLEIKKATQ